jgi:nitrous oxidase accessory protein NosD
MSRRAISVAALTLALLAVAATPAAAATITVDDSGGEDHTTIQDAVDAATSGDTIEVADGTYSEDVSINKTDLTIKSSTGDAATSDATVEGNISLDSGAANGTTVEGMDIDGGHIAINGNDQVTIKDTKVVDASGLAINSLVPNQTEDLRIDGVTVDGVPDANSSALFLSEPTPGLRVLNNDFNDTQFGGMVLVEPSDAIIRNNTVSNTPRQGIQVNSATNVSIKNNTLEDVSAEAGPYRPPRYTNPAGAIVAKNNSDTEIFDNTITNAEIGIVTWTEGGALSDDTVEICGNSIDADNEIDDEADTLVRVTDCSTTNSSSTDRELLGGSGGGGGAAVVVDTGDGFLDGLPFEIPAIAGIPPKRLLFLGIAALLFAGFWNNRKKGGRF